MKILAFAASNSRSSINKKLVTHACEVMKAEINPDAEIDLIDLNDFELPLYSIDRENESGIPAKAQEFYDKFGACDAVIVSFAEHNGSYAVAYKNIYDWASRINAKVFQGKPMLIMACSPGGRGGAGVLGTITGAAPRFGGEVVASFGVGPYGEKFDAEAGKLADEELAGQLRDGLRGLVGTA